MMRVLAMAVLSLFLVGGILGCAGQSGGSAYLAPPASPANPAGDGGPAGKGGATPGEAIDPNRKIVIFKADTSDAAKESACAKHGSFVKHLSSINASVVVLRAPKEKDSLAARPEVLRVEDDVEVTTLGIEPKGGGNQTVAQASQTTPWGITRISATQAWALSTAANVKIAVIDTGVATGHPDLVVAGGINTINPNKGYNDDNGHGSHVAGIVSAQNNAVGVVGGGYSAALYAVKVLGANGSGYLSDVIEGIQWCMANGIRLANLSLGTTTDSAALHDAVKAASLGGLILVAAAGNANGGAVTYPAAYPEIIAVAASTQGDAFASYSSAGPEVDLIAPGDQILSTYKGTAYKILSGTSMAAPHVTAACGLKLALSPTLTPPEMHQALQGSADPLPLLTASQQGAGLVNAKKLVGAP